MIKAIVFDVGGVLHEASGDYIFQDIMQALEITEETLKKALHRNMDKLRKGEITEKQFWSLFLKRAKSKKTLPKESLLLREFIKNYNLNNEAMELAKKLKNKGYIIAVLSNSIEPHAKYQYKIGIYQKFDVVILSHEVGMQKPGQRIYKHLLRKLNLRPEEVFFVDDRINNVEAASKIGIHAVIFKNIIQLETDLKRLGVEA